MAIFPKRVNPCFWSKNDHFSNFFFYAILVSFKVEKNWNFFKNVNPWFCSKNGNCSILFFGSIGHENFFYDILERKNAFPGCKNKKFKKSKNGYFSKEGKPMLLIQKWPFFQLFFSGNIGKENFFYDILQRKNAFLGYKNKKFKKSKNTHFFKGVNPWFWSKNDHFSKIS